MNQPSNHIRWPQLQFGLAALLAAMTLFCVFFALVAAFGAAAGIILAYCGVSLLMLLHEIVAEFRHGPRQS